MSNLISSYINYKNNILLNEGWSPKVHTTISIYDEKNPPNVVISPCKYCAVNQHKGEECRCGSNRNVEDCCGLKLRIGQEKLSSIKDDNFSCPICGDKNVSSDDVKKHNFSAQFESIIYLWNLYRQIEIINKNIDDLNYFKVYKLVNLITNNVVQVSGADIKSILDAVNFAKTKYPSGEFSIENVKECKFEFANLDRNDRINFIKNRKEKFSDLKKFKNELEKLHERIKFVCDIFRINHQSVLNVINKTKNASFDGFYSSIVAFGSGIITSKYDKSLENKLVIRFSFDSYALKRGFNGSNYDGVKIVKNINGNIEKKFLRGIILNKNSVIDSDSQEYPPPVKIRTSGGVIDISFDEKEGYVREDCGIFFKEDNAWRWAGSEESDYNSSTFTINDLRGSNSTPSKIIIDKFIPFLENKLDIKRMPGLGFPSIDIMDKYNDVKDVLNFNKEDFSIIVNNFNEYSNSDENRKNVDERKCSFTILEIEESIKITSPNDYILLFGSLDESRKKSKGDYFGNLRNIATYKTTLDDKFDKEEIDEKEYESDIKNYNIIVKELSSDLDFISSRNKRKILAIKNNKLILSYGIIGDFEINHEFVLFNTKTKNLELIKCKNVNNNISYEDLLKCIYGKGPFVDNPERRKHGYKSITKKLDKIKEINDLITSSNYDDEIEELIDKRDKIGNENSLRKELNNIKRDRSQKNAITKGIGKDLFFICDSNKLEGKSLEEKCKTFDKFINNNFQNEMEAAYKNDKNDKLHGMILQNKNITNLHGEWTISSIMDSKGSTEFNSYKLLDSIDTCLNCDGEGYVEKDVIDTYTKMIEGKDHEDRDLTNYLTNSLLDIYKNSYEDFKSDYSFEEFMEEFRSKLKERNEVDNNFEKVEFLVKYKCDECNGSGFNYIENKILNMRKSSSIYNFNNGNDTYKYMIEVRDKYIIYYFKKPENVQINSMDYDYDEVNEIFSGLSRGEILIKNPPIIDDVIQIINTTDDESKYFLNLENQFTKYGYKDVEFRIKIAKKRFANKIIQMFYKSINSYGYSKEINRSLRNSRINNIKYSAHIKNIVHGLNRIYNEFKNYINKINNKMPSDDIKICTFMTVNLLVKRNLEFVNEYNLHKRFNLLNIYYYDDFELYIVDKLINGNVSQEETGTIRKRGITLENSRGSFQTEVNHKLSGANRNFIVALFEDFDRKFYFSEIYKKFYGNSDKLHFFVNNNIKDFIIENSLMDRAEIDEFNKNLLTYIYSVKKMVKDKYENFNLKKIHQILSRFSDVRGLERYSTIITVNLNNFAKNLLLEPDYDVDILKMVEEVCNNFIKNLGVENHAELSKNITFKIKSEIGDINNIYSLNYDILYRILSIVDKDILSDQDRFSLSVEIINLLERD